MSNSVFPHIDISVGARPTILRIHTLCPPQHHPRLKMLLVSTSFSSQHPPRLHILPAFNILLHAFNILLAAFAIVLAAFAIVLASTSSSPRHRPPRPKIILDSRSSLSPLYRPPGLQHYPPLTIPYPVYSNTVLLKRARCFCGQCSDKSFHIVTYLTQNAPTTAQFSYLIFIHVSMLRGIHKKRVATGCIRHIPTVIKVFRQSLPWTVPLPLIVHCRLSTLLLHYGLHCFEILPVE